MPKPVIGITADVETKINSRGAKEERYFLKKALADSVALAGGVPVILPFVKTPNEAVLALSGVGGLLISGGDFDIDPGFYGEKRIPGCGPAKQERTKSEFLLLALALRKNLPVLGICGGEQVINVYFGGSLYQDIPSQMTGALRHSQKEPHTVTTHAVEVESGTLLGRIAKPGKLKVNSTHHQGVKKPGRGLAVSATAPDGCIEAVEGKGGFLLGVQWHPEFLVKDARHFAIFRAFVRASRS